MAPGDMALWLAYGGKPSAKYSIQGVVVSCNRR